MIGNRKFEKFIKIYGTPLAILLGAVVIALAINGPSNLARSGIWSNFSGFGGKSSTGNPPAGESQQVVVSADDDAFLGAANAPVTMIEFSDFQCPFCRKFWRESLLELKTKYITAGKVRLVYRDFPLFSLHPGAEPAAEAGQCAAEQGKFWDFHDKIFTEQDKQGQGTVQLRVEDLKTWAEETGLNTKQFNSCLDSGKYKEEVAKDLANGIAAGVDGTPTFFINGQKVVGALPFEDFARVIDQALAKK